MKFNISPLILLVSLIAPSAEAASRREKVKGVKGSVTPEERRILELAAKDVMMMLQPSSLRKRRSLGSKGSKSSKSRKGGYTDVLIENLSCTECLGVDVEDLGTTLRFCDKSDETQRWNLAPFDKIGVWFQLKNQETGKCIQTATACSSDIIMGSCDSSNGNTVWGYTGGQFYNYQCFFSQENSASLLGARSGTCKDNLDLETLSGIGEDATWILVPDFSASMDGSDTCPTGERPNPGDNCPVNDMICIYGEECCCGECSHSYECKCDDGKWQCFYTDFCFDPCDP